MRGLGNGLPCFRVLHYYIGDKSGRNGTHRTIELCIALSTPLQKDSRSEITTLQQGLK